MSSIKIQDGLPDIVAARFQEAKESGDLHAFDSTAAVLELNGIPVTIPHSFLHVLIVLFYLYILRYPFLYTPPLLPSYYPSFLPISPHALSSIVLLILAYTFTRSFLYTSFLLLSTVYLIPVAPSFS